MTVEDMRLSRSDQPAKPMTVPQLRKALGRMLDSYGRQARALSDDLTGPQYLAEWLVPGATKQQRMTRAGRVATDPAAVRQLADRVDQLSALLTDHASYLRQLAARMAAEKGAQL